MSFLNHEWLGFAATPTEAIRIIKDTSIFYLVVSFSYVLSILYMSWHSKITKKLKKTHYIYISMWLFFGITTLLQPSIFSTIINLSAILLALCVLFQLQFTSILSAQITLSDIDVATDNKKALYAKTLLMKADYNLNEVIGVTIINEQILWLIILYRALVAFRASFGM